MDNLIRKYALQNAVLYKGRANQGAVIGKVIAEQPDLKRDMKALARQVGAIIKEVNALSPEDQHSKLEQLAPELLEKKEREERDIFEGLGIKEGEKVVTCFPPEPSKYPHIGHAKAILLNHDLARKHDGRFILRFEDTNPELAQQEFYDLHQDNYAWLGIKTDEVVYASDHMDAFYRAAEKLVKDGHAYLCDIPQDEFSTYRRDGREAPSRNRSIEENLKLWEEFKTAPQGSYVLRLKGDMASDNTVMRDPTLMRIIDSHHPRTKDKYRLWPTYDFENAVMDGIQGITHRLRTKEFELRNELQRRIQKLLGHKPTKIFEFARFNLEGVESSGRKIRELLQEGKLIGWDDPTLTTLVALRRRGFTPEAIRNFCLSTGISKAEATLTWDDLVVQNRRVLDRDATRYFFIHDPRKITVKDAPEQEVKLRKHPDDKARGTRDHKTGAVFYLAKADLDSLEDGKLYRLMDCLNFRKEGDSFTFVSTDVADYRKEGKRIMHWLPASEDLIEAEVMMPDKSVVKGLAEPGVKEIEEGAVIQFERFGFCRLDSKKDNKFWYTHK